MRDVTISKANREQGIIHLVVTNDESYKALMQILNNGIIIE
jgi:hypothetical protein